MRTIIIALTGSLLLSAPAHAGKSDAAVAVGAGTTVGGHTGLQVGKHFSDDLGLRATLGFAFGGRTTVGASLYLDQALLGGEGGGIQLVAGLDTRLTQAPDTTGDTVTSPDFGLGVGLQGDVFLTPSLSLWAHAGLTAWLFGRATNANALGVPVTDNLESTGLAVQLGPDNALGTLGFTWWIGAE